MIKIKDYTIEWSIKQGRFTCTCPDFQYRRSQHKNEICKHIQEALDKKLITEGQYQDKRYHERKYFEVPVIVINNDLKNFKYEICGSWRRRAPYMKDLDVVVFVGDEIKRLELMKIISAEFSIEYGGDKRITTKWKDVQIDFRICDNIEHWPFMTLFFTGSKKENIRLRKKAKEMNMKLNEYGLYQSLSTSGFYHNLETEQEIYEALNEKYKPPWQRN